MIAYLWVSASLLFIKYHTWRLSDITFRQDFILYKIHPENRSPSEFYSCVFSCKNLYPVVRTPRASQAFISFTSWGWRESEDKSEKEKDALRRVGRSAWSKSKEGNEFLSRTEGLGFASKSNPSSLFNPWEPSKIYEKIGEKLRRNDTVLHTVLLSSLEKYSRKNSPAR